MIEVEVEDAAWTAASPAVETQVQGWARAALSHGQPRLVGADGDIVVLLADDAAVRALNLQHRGMDAPTNVLAFPAADSARPHLGDVALAYGVCAREAEVQGKPFAHHVAHLVVHGVLHLLGYDHQVDAQAQAMEAVERAILAGCGVADPYAYALEPTVHG